MISTVPVPSPWAVPCGNPFGNMMCPANNGAFCLWVPANIVPVLAFSEQLWDIMECKPRLVPWRFQPRGFSSNIGFQNLLYAEVWAIKQGLELANEQMGFVGFIVESNSRAAIKMIQGNSPRETDCHSALLKEIEKLLVSLAKQDKICKLQHIFREANEFADFLAKQGGQQSEELEIREEQTAQLHLRLHASRGCIYVHGS
ncbi:hypothetical protein CRG98_042173 [Punica granatum]|uniref:RNase H type-1 domain-containing protein n=1 Tax=Punica granatum TaxID=22663 RepID=A0A2I0I0F3_PUNGR|nr:hypothetical protein CRG98_042173 [Punica granatum]